MLKVSKFHVDEVDKMNELLANESYAFGMDYMKQVGPNNQEILIFYADKKPEELKAGDEGYDYGLQKKHTLGILDKFISEQQGHLIDAKLNLEIAIAEDKLKRGGTARQDERRARIGDFEYKIENTTRAINTAKEYLTRVQAGEDITRVDLNETPDA